MKREVARSRSRREGGERRIIRRERGLGRVEFVNKHLVEAEVAGEGKLLRGVHDDAMPVRAFLPRLVHARALVLDEGAGCAERAIGLDRQRLDAATAVVRHHHALARAVHVDVAGAGAAGRLLVQGRELSGRRINGERADRAGLLVAEL